MRVNRALVTGAYSERELYITGPGQRKSQLTEGFSCAVPGERHARKGRTKTQNPGS